MRTTIRGRERLDDGVRDRAGVFESFFAREAELLAVACRAMAERFATGGRLLAFGAGPAGTDAQHVAVEFLHPVIVGKRALPAVDLGARAPLAGERFANGLVRPADIVMGFGPPGGEEAIDHLVRDARRIGALTFALPGDSGDYTLAASHPDPFIHQELIEVLYHTLWETVHVFFEHGSLGQDAGSAAFLYPFLGQDKQGTEHLVAHVASSILAKARENERLREATFRREGEAIASAAEALHTRLARGGTLLLAGNGGSATDATDWALDGVASPKGHRPISALSLAGDPATLSAIANDVGVEAMFERQIIAHAAPHDALAVISTSGSSANLIAALEEARRRGLMTMALLGYDGGAIVERGLVDHAIVVRSDSIPRIQEVHASIYHGILEVLHALDEA